MTDGRPTVVVPCYNEERRLDGCAFLELAASDRIRLLFVNDGSTDATQDVLEDLTRRSEVIDAVQLPKNHGKAEAVRQGLLHTLAHNQSSIVGYLDADLATPGHEFLRILDTLESDEVLMAVWGSRIARLGSRIDRRALRHYLGRIFATAASIALDIPVYDTQCGAKVFRVTDTFRRAIDRPFRSAWSFDVVLIERLLDGSDDCPGLPIASFLELPLEDWRDVPGSTMRPMGSIAAVRDLWSVAVTRRRAMRRLGKMGGESDPYRRSR
jgi:glycosyltransferase involved in cell wall biosynthesis